MMSSDSGLSHLQQWSSTPATQAEVLRQESDAVPRLALE